MSDNEYTEQSYFTDVTDMAVEIREQHKACGSDFEESDVLHEYVDGSSWVIYYARARQVLEYSDNDCAIFEELGPQQWEDWGTAFCQAAFFAMHRDVSEALAELPEIETCDDCDASYNEDEDHDCPEAEGDED